MSETVEFDIEVARRAYAHISMRPDVRAEQERAAFVAHLAAVRAELATIAETDAQRAVLDERMDAYAAGYRSRLYAVLGAASRTASVAITGPARFDHRRNRKALDTEARRATELETWSGNEQRRMRAAILAARTPEQADEDAYRRLSAAIARDVAIVRAIDAGESPFARQAFTASAARMLRSAAKQGHAGAVARVLADLRADDARCGKPFFGAGNSVWRLDAPALDPASPG